MFQSRWGAMQRARRHGTHGTAATDALTVLAVISLLTSAAFWLPAYWAFVGPQTWGEVAQALAGGVFMVAGPPTLMAFLIPWSPAGMLLQRLNARTWGQVVVLACGLFLLYFSGTVLYAYWGARPNATTLAPELALTSVIATVLVPALLWAPVSDEELAERVKQTQAVDRLKLEMAAERNILRGTLLHAQQKALVGLANLTAGDRDELIAVMSGLVRGIDQEIQAIAGELEATGGIAVAAHSLEESPEVQRLLGEAVGTISRYQLMAPAPVADVAYDRDPAHRWGHEQPQSVPAAVSTVNAAVSDVPSSSSSRTVPAGVATAETVYDAIVDALPPTFTKKTVAELGSVQEETARKYLRAWRDAGLIDGEGMPNGVYRLARHNGGAA